MGLTDADAGLKIAERYAAEQEDDSDLYVNIDADDVEFMAKACVALAKERDSFRKGLEGLTVASLALEDERHRAANEAIDRELALEVQLVAARAEVERLTALATKIENARHRAATEANEREAALEEQLATMRAGRDKAIADAARLTKTRDHTCTCTHVDASAPTIHHAKECPIRVNLTKRLAPEVALERLATALHSGDENDELRAEIERLTESLRIAVAVRDDARAASQRRLDEKREAEAEWLQMAAMACDDQAKVAIERDAYRAMICDLLASAHPHPAEHPTMTRQWARARELLKNGPTVDSASLCPECGCKLADKFRAELEHHADGCRQAPVG